jgi:hypothetical protein
MEIARSASASPSTYDPHAFDTRDCQSPATHQVHIHHCCYRLITIYDLKVTLLWTGTTADGTEVSGSLLVPEVSHEIALDGLSDYVVRVSAQPYAKVVQAEEIWDLVRLVIIHGILVIGRRHLHPRQEAAPSRPRGTFRLLSQEISDVYGRCGRPVFASHGREAYPDVDAGACPVQAGAGHGLLAIRRRCEGQVCVSRAGEKDRANVGSAKPDLAFRSVDAFFR